MSEHPKDKLARLNKLVSEIPDVSRTEIKSSTNSANDANAIEALKTRKRKAGRPKGSKNKNVGFKKKDLAEMASAARVLWHQKMVTWKLKPEQQCLVDSFKNRTADTLVWVLGRQWGKTINSSTYVMTPKGPVMMVDLEVGDQVIGYNKDGSTSPTNILQKTDNGIEEMYDLVYQKDILATCTDDHIWLTRNNAVKGSTQKRLGDFRGYDQIVRKFVDNPLGDINEPHAYSIGALLGDGCSRQGHNKIHISSNDDKIPNKIAEELGCFVGKNEGNNYTWMLSTVDNFERWNKSARSEKLHCNYYDDWMKDRYAHEKIVDLDVIKTWNRDSQLRLLAGLLDSDGSVTVNSETDRSLVISIGMQAKSVIDAVQYMFYSLFQSRVKIHIDNRAKYKNGPVYTAKCRYNVFTKRALYELDKYIVSPQKKWKPEYADFNERNLKQDYVGVRKENKREEQGWDIFIDNDTNLFLTQDGLVTHNSFSIAAIIIEECLNNPGLRVAYVCPQKAQARSVVEKNFNIILNDCPPELRPKFDVQGSVWKFANGSIIRVAGLDGGHIESLRGQTFDIVIVDEAGFPSAADIEYALESVLYPTMTISDKPLLLLVSTPPKTFDHPFNDYWDKAKENGTLIHKTLYDSWLPKAQVYKIEERYGKETVSFRREYMAERIADASSLVIPEANPAVIEKISYVHERPSHYQTYVSADWGVMDNNVILFGYLDWSKQIVVVEDELILTGSEYDTAKIADAIKAKEQELWGEMSRPFRCCDNNLQIIQDFSNLHQLYFLATAKDNKQAAVNQVRVRISGKQFAINPRCKTLLNHVQNATWDKQRKKFRQAIGHHYDALDALIYMVRNIDFQKSPYPKNHFVEGNFMSPKFERRQRMENQGNMEEFAQSLFTPRRKSRK